MIATGTAEEIRELLAAGELSQRRIAQRTGVSRGTVQAIARQRHGQTQVRSRREAGEGFVFPAGPARRCPVCGAKVQMPCLACHVRAIIQRHRKCR